MGKASFRILVGVQPTAFASKDDTAAAGPVEGGTVGLCAMAFRPNSVCLAVKFVNAAAAEEFGFLKGHDIGGRPLQDLLAT